MYHGLTFYTKLGDQQLKNFRLKYDPTVELVDDHIGIIFPVPDKITEIQISKHIESVLSSWKPFNVHIDGYVKNWDHLLFLTLEQGSEEVVRLFNDMYTGILKPYFRIDLPFTPHISVGYFGEGQFDIFNPNDKLDENKYRFAVKEIEKINLDYWRQVDVLTLVSLNDELTELKDVGEFRL